MSISAFFPKSDKTMKPSVVADNLYIYFSPGTLSPASHLTSVVSLKPYFAQNCLLFILCNVSQCFILNLKTVTGFVFSIIQMINKLYFFIKGV